MAVAECTAGFLLSTLLAPAVRDQAIGFEIEMRLNLVGKVAVRPTSAKERDQLGSVSGPSTRAMAAASRRHLVDSRPRCSRPVLVNE